MFSLSNNSLKYFNLMFLSVFHQLQYFSHVHMLCATCKSSPQVLRLKPWTCAGKKKKKDSDGPSQSWQRVCVYFCPETEVCTHPLSLVAYFSVTSGAILLIHHLQGLPPVWRRQWKGWRPNVHHGPPGPRMADICMADTRFLSSAFGFCCEVKFTLLKACTRFLGLLWKVVISIIFQYVYFKLRVCFLLFYRKMY